MDMSFLINKGAYSLFMNNFCMINTMHGLYNIKIKNGNEISGFVKAKEYFD